MVWSEGGGPRTGRFSGADSATAGTMEDDAAVPPPSSDDLSTTGDLDLPRERRVQRAVAVTCYLCHIHSLCPHVVYDLP